MAVLFGFINFTRAKADPEKLAGMARMTRPWVERQACVVVSQHLAMGYQGDGSEEDTNQGPAVVQARNGMLVTFLGRLDNRSELVGRFSLTEHSSSDADLVAAGFERHGTQVFSAFKGDWAIALWDSQEDLLYLARDHAGTKPLYFDHTEKITHWSSYLESWDELRIGRRMLNVHYAASYLMGCPHFGSSPLSGVHEVVPGHYVCIGRSGFRQRSHWLPDPGPKLQLRSNEDYDERFLSLFGAAVARRTKFSDRVLAHLSGGVDSTAIVCVSDRLRVQQDMQRQVQLDTVSFFDDTEPGWNERPYFEAVSVERGKPTLAVDVSESGHTLCPAPITNGAFVLPGYDSGSWLHEHHFQNLIATKNYTAILSGLGGDELFGGVPSPLPELGDLLARGRFMQLSRQGMRWAITLRQPLLSLVWSAAQFSFRAAQGRSLDSHRPPWLTQRVYALAWEPPTPNLFRRLAARCPSNLAFARSWWSLLMTLPHPHHFSQRRMEHRFPFLDRDLVEFALRLPHEQLVLPGRRRHLMRRALAGIVPPVVLERRRKAYIERRPLLNLHNNHLRMRELIQSSELVETGYIDRKKFEKTLDDTLAGGRPEWTNALMKTCLLDLWLRSNMATPIPI